MTISEELPALDEFEVTLLGRGVGESCVLHLGDNEWMVVDSFTSGRRGAAEVYLTRIGVDFEDVRHILVTHLHRDHYRSVESLHDNFPYARLWLTSALRNEQFRKLYNDKSLDPILGALPGTVYRARDRVVSGSVNGLASLKVGSDVVRHGQIEVRAISPSEAAVQASCSEIAGVISGGHDAIERHLRDDNRCSVALHIKCFGMVALLGADLPALPERFGWAAVLDEPRHRELEPAGIVKVPHHGSAGAEDRRMWSRLVAIGAPMLVTPYTSMANPIPTVDDCRRLLNKGGRLWQSAPSFSRRIGGHGSATKMRGFGIVQARRKQRDLHWNVRAEAPAFEVLLDG